MCFWVLFHQLVPMGPLFHALIPSPGSFGSCAFSGRLRFRFGRLVQALPSSPPSLVLARFRRPPLFFSLAFPGFARSGPGALVCVFSFLPFLRSPLGFLLSNFSSHFHRHFTFIVFHFHLHLIAGTLV